MLYIRNVLNGRVPGFKPDWEMPMILNFHGSCGKIEGLKHIDAIDEHCVFPFQYAPYKEGSKGTLAARAKEVGLEPLALNVLNDPNRVNFNSWVKQGKKGQCDWKLYIVKTKKHVQIFFFFIFSFLV